MELERTSDISELKFDKKNFNKHTPRGMGMLEKSLNKFGAGRSILVDKDNNIIAGNGIVEAAASAGITKTRVIETTGDELVVVKRTDVELGSHKGRRMAFADNATASADLEWDEENVKSELTKEETDEWGADVAWEDDTLFKDNERDRTFAKYNLDLFREDLSTGKWQIPSLMKETMVPSSLLGFNYAKTAKDFNATIHFFLDDYQFERLWEQPENYVSLLSNFEAILSPDFSLYSTMPLAVQLWNTYRSRLLGQFFQNAGIQVIPTISWSNPESFEFCFDGVEKGSTIAVSTVGVLKNDKAKELFLLGFREAIKRLEPSTVVAYGNKIDIEPNPANIVWFSNETTDRMKGKNESI